MGETLCQSGDPNVLRGSGVAARRLAIDNGKGFSEDELERVNGIRNMRERSREVGGKLELLSQPGEGTTLRFRKSF